MKTQIQKVLKRFRSTKFKATFPLSVQGEGVVGGMKEVTPRMDRGVALIIALIVIAMMMIFTSDLIVTSQVALETTVVQRDSAKAEYLAKSAVNLGLFLLSADFVADLFLAGPQSPMKTSPSDGPSDFWAMLNGLPIGGGTAEILGMTQKALGIESVNDSAISDVLKLFDGEFVLDVSDEGGKININQCAIGRCVEVLKMLSALFDCPVERAYLARNNVRVNELIFKLKDFVDTDRRAEPETGVADEDDPYSKETPPYKAKNAPFDSFKEIQLVDGWTQDIDAIFGPYITIFPFQSNANDKAKININSAPKELLSCLVPSSMRDCRDKFELSMAEKSEDKANVATDQASILSTLKQNFCYDPDKEEPSGNDETVKENRAQWFVPLSSVFRINASGQVNGRVRQITMVIQREISDPSRKNPHIYRPMYWKML